MPGEEVDRRPQVGDLVRRDLALPDLRDRPVGGAGALAPPAVVEGEGRDAARGELAGVAAGHLLLDGHPRAADHRSRHAPARREIRREVQVAHDALPRGRERHALDPHGAQAALRRRGCPGGGARGGTGLCEGRERRVAGARTRAHAHPGDAPATIVPACELVLVATLKDPRVAGVRAVPHGTGHDVGGVEAARGRRAVPVTVTRTSVTSCVVRSNASRSGSQRATIAGGVRSSAVP
jgi:hypothetical protein